MENIFLKVLNLSLTASWIVLAVIILRLLLKKAPKWINCLLWGIVAIRLALPFSFESVLSLLPTAEPIPQNIATMREPAIDSGLGIVNNAINPIVSYSFSPSPMDSANPLQIILPIASIIWIIGILALLIYGAVSYIRLKIRVSPSILYKDNIYYCDNISTPFIFGIIRPKIYLPSGTDENYTDYIVYHEKAHLKRLDHITKPLGFLLLAVYWFNPFIWLSNILFCRDIESACDQKVIKDMDNQNKKNYLDALISCSVHKRAVLSCPLAFGEVGVKGRVKSVINYKKPAFWIIIISVITCVAVAVGFLTNPKTNNTFIKNSGSDLEGLSVKVVSLNDFYIGVKWINDTENQIVFGEEFYILKYKNGKWEDCRKTKEYAWNLIAYSVGSLEETEHKYSLADLSVTSDGIYRFESDCFIDGKPKENYKVWTEFEIKNGVLTDNVFVNDGEVFFYTKATNEHENSTIEKTAEFGSGFNSFLKTLKNQNWTDDYFTDRISFDFNGKIYYSGNWLYFSYDQKVVYYDHYFCDADENVINAIKKTEEKAKEFSEILEYKFENSVDDIIKPNIRLSKIDGTFQFIYSGYSSYVAVGSYEYYDDTLVCRTDDGSNTYVFRVKNSKSLIFDASNSSKIPEYRYSEDSDEKQSPVPDGARFTLLSQDDTNQNPYFNATVLEVYENSVLVEPFKDEEIRENSDKISVNIEVISTNPVPKLKKGMEIRVVYNGVILESYPASLGGVFAIYELDKNGEVIFKSGDEVKYIFDPIEICYSNEMYSYVADVDGLPTYEIINNMELYEMNFNGPYNLHGEMTKIELTQEKFDLRFSTDIWNKSESIRQNNKNAWEIYSGLKVGDTPLLYLLLEQNNGTFYLAEGYYNIGSSNPVTSDDSQIRSVYKLKQVENLQQANPKW